MRYPIKAAAIATGVSESRLRTWERRYGIPRPARSSSGRRLYDEHDLTVIRRMAALVSVGLGASEAAQAALLESGPTRPEPPRPIEEHPLVGSIVEASLSYDEPSISQAIQEAVTEMGWSRALDLVLFPALRKIGEYWGESLVVSANEHFTSAVIGQAMAASLRSTTSPARHAPSVLLACPEDERHELGLLGASLLLRLRGLRVFYLGGDVPTSDLLLAIQQTKVNAVCLAATTASGLASLRRAAGALVSSRIPVLLFVGGPAFDPVRAGGESETVPGVRLPQSLEAAAEVIVSALKE